MSYPNRTFVSYYQFKNGKVKEILIRPSVTILKTPVFKGAFVETANSTVIDGMIADIISITEDNTVMPVTVINDTALATDIGTLIAQGIIATNGNTTKGSLKVGLTIPNSGPNSGLGVLTFTYKHNGVSAASEQVIEDAT